MKKSLFVLFFLLAVAQSKAATCIALFNTDWATAGSWSCGFVPGCGDSIVIPAGITVTITSQQDYSGCPANAPMKITIYGTLKFTNGNKLKLNCESIIYIFPGGSIQPGTGGGNSNYIEVCGDNYWNAASGPLSGPTCIPPSTPGCGVVLPIELINLTGKPNNGFIELSWITATEKNSNYFDVERSSDATDFIKKITVNSKAPNGNSSTQLDYFCTDNDPLFDVSYYRLKQVDFNGLFSYSKVISVNYLKAKNIRFVIYPNPNNGEFTADISGIENNHEVSLILKGPKGRILYESKFYFNEQNDSKFQIIPDTKLAAGIYVCTLIIEEIEYNVKVIVS
ncbi:MAG: hypothetical protein Q7W45_16870 [Bacteroidota bacterium]|nr:hypothetical protein [Bacteroidota bacterium]MDP3145313.1 hypothetical protein [Bacteroidota bacterium]MDP3557618.1 hypothetical protein [Bacteroidota bacterium]